MKQQHHASTTSLKRLFNKPLLVFLLAAGFAFPAMAQQPAPLQRTISVSGTAEMEVVPDEIYVQVDLREYDKKNGPKIDIESIKNNFLSACKSIGLSDSDLSVQGYQGWDGNLWLYRKNKKQNPDLKASISYWVKVNSTRKMDELVSKMDDEATQHFFIAKVDHSKMDTFKKQLKMEAIKAAKEKAVYLAGAINEQVGQAITINDPSETNNYPRPMYANAMLKTAVQDEAAAPAMNVDFKKIDLQFEVNVVFALK